MTELILPSGRIKKSRDGDFISVRRADVKIPYKLGSIYLHHNFMVSMMHHTISFCVEKQNSIDVTPSCHNYVNAVALSSLTGKTFIAERNPRFIDIDDIFRDYLYDDEPNEMLAHILKREWPELSALQSKALNRWYEVSGHTDKVLLIHHPRQFVDLSFHLRVLSCMKCDYLEMLHGLFEYIVKRCGIHADPQDYVNSAKFISDEQRMRSFIHKTVHGTAPSYCSLDFTLNDIEDVVMDDDAMDDPEVVINAVLARFTSWANFDGPMLPRSEIYTRIVDDMDYNVYVSIPSSEEIGRCVTMMGSSEDDFVLRSLEANIIVCSLKLSLASSMVYCPDKTRMIISQGLCMPRYTRGVSSTISSVENHKIAADILAFSRKVMKYGPAGHAFWYALAGRDDILRWNRSIELSGNGIASGDRPMFCLGLKISLPCPNNIYFGSIESHSAGEYLTTLSEFNMFYGAISRIPTDVEAFLSDIAPSEDVQLKSFHELVSKVSSPAPIAQKVKLEAFPVLRRAISTALQGLKTLGK